MKNFIVYTPAAISSSDHVTVKEQWYTSQRMVLDGVTLSNLNILPDELRSDEAADSLLATIDFCHTSFGKLIFIEAILIGCSYDQSC